MKSKIKSYLKLIYRYYRYKKNIWLTLKFSLVALFKFYAPSMNIEKGKQLQKLFDKVNIEIDKEGFIYFVDIYKTICNKNRPVDNITIDYKYLLENSLEDIKNKTMKIKESDFKNNQLLTIEAIENLIDRIAETSKSKYGQYIKNIKQEKAKSFEEALQRILFFNQLLWQTNHNLNGLGRLDLILDPYYKKEIKNKEITKEKAQKLIADFCDKLNKYYWFKSNGLVGDTGQVIVLGGLDPKQNYFYNDLTYIFIDVIQKMNKPDPKTIVRVSSKMQKALLKKSFESIMTGIGNPLFSNDDVVIDKLIKFGYQTEDAYNYCTSACWEPYIAGKSFDQNNIDTFLFIKPLLTLFETEDLEKYDTFDKLLEDYKKELKEYLNQYIKEINNIKFEKDPLISLSCEICLQNEKDINFGGAKYNHYGLTTVSLSNTVNSLINIKKFCYTDKIISLQKLNEIRKNNFQNHKEVLEELKKQKIRYGTDNEEVIDLTTEITTYATQITNEKKNPLGGKIKFGLSSPSYITMKNIPATFDGRKNNDPFNVHISNDSAANAYTELINFAASINYNENRFNGNVVDLILNPLLAEGNIDDFLNLLMIGIKKGFFQMQINVLNSETLINAKKNPDEYPNLIVRVWGFSAYFNDLPEVYKDVLIERALINEGKN